MWLARRCRREVRWEREGRRRSEFLSTHSSSRESGREGREERQLLATSRIRRETREASGGRKERLVPTTWTVGSAEQGNHFYVALVMTT